MTRGFALNAPEAGGGNPGPPAAVQGDEPLMENDVNKERRKTLEEAYRLIDQGRDMVDGVAQEEREVFDNMPESFQNGERGQRVSENADNLEEVVSTIQEMLDKIDEATQ